MIQIAADLGEQSLSRVLAEDGRWKPSSPAVLVAEGLLQYLSDDEVRGVFNEASACTASGSWFVFTHAIPGTNRLISILTSLIAERWKSGVASEDLPEYIAGAGWEIASEPDTNPEHGVERYALARRS